MEGVEKVFEVAGDMDLFVLVRYDSPKKLNKIIDAVRGMRAVKSTKSFVVLEEYEK
jgi:DNA-binding Lrp family transcriptional regulator